MTVVTVVAIAAVGGFFYVFIWPGIQRGLAMNTCNNICPGGKASDVNTKENTCTCADGTEMKFKDEE